MKTKTKWILSTLAFATVGFLLAPNTPLGEAVWGPMPEAPAGAGPTGPQMGLLVFMGLVQALAFGLGWTMLLLGWRFVSRWGRPGSAALLALGWGLVSWVPHTAMHATAGDDLSRLIAIEYAFHMTLIVAAAAVSWFVLSFIGRATGAQGPASARPAPGVRSRPSAPSGRP